MRYLVLIVSLLLCLKSVGQNNFDSTKISKKALEQVNKLAESRCVKGSAIGEGGERPPEFDFFLELCKIASKEELIGLTKHPSPVIRCYSFWALVDYHKMDFYQLILEHIDDTESVYTFFGCVIDEKKVADFYIDWAAYAQPPILNPVQFNQLDSVLIYYPNDLEAKRRLMMRR